MPEPLSIVRTDPEKYCKMPDLSDLLRTPVVHQLLASQLFGNDQGFPHPLRLYRVTFARLIDKATIEYCQARVSVLAELQVRHQTNEEWQEYGNPLFVLSIANNFENCLSTTRRVFRYFGRIKADFPTNRALRRTLLATEREVVKIRNAVEHLDDRIHRGFRRNGEPLIVATNEDASAVRLLGTSLMTASLARTLRRLHEFASEFTDYAYEDGKFVKVTARTREPDL